ncbi:hypothetical protein TURU_123318 [Turdus rufiventris]|nr:hypothetical protein TURU_123318 [Turdus rufiventris]
MWRKSSFPLESRATLVSQNFCFILERHGFEGWSIWWIKNWLDGCTQRVVVNSSVLVWILVISGVPQGSVLGLTPFNILSVGNIMDSGIKGTLSKFATNTKLCGAVNMLERRDVIQRDLDRLERWDCANPMKAKAKVMYLDQSNPRQSCRREGTLPLCLAFVRPHLASSSGATSIRRAWNCWSKSRGGP